MPSEPCEKNDAKLFYVAIVRDKLHMKYSTSDANNI